MIASLIIYVLVLSMSWHGWCSITCVQRSGRQAIEGGCDRVYGQEFCQILRYVFSQFKQYLYCFVLAFIEERRCQIMIGLWQYVISEMGFEMPRDVEVNGFHLRFCMRTNLVL